MKLKNILIVSIIAASLLMISTIALATPSASILYYETYLEDEGLWQYNYMFYNTSDAGEYLYKVFLNFDQSATVTGSPLPTGWVGTVWEGRNTTLYLDAMSIDSNYDIPANNSSLSGFSFTIDYQAGNISFIAEFDDHKGNLSTFTGTTTVMPEPVSSLLFIAGGATLAARRMLRKKRQLS
jgi:hypothetical protein